jgi:hypothetical protein
MENPSPNPARRRRRKRRPQGAEQTPSLQSQTNANDPEKGQGRKNRSPGGNRNRQGAGSSPQNRSGKPRGSGGDQGGRGGARARSKNGPEGEGKSRRGGKSRRKAPATAWEKFLFAVSFGLLGKSDAPSPKGRGKTGNQKAAKPASRKADGKPGKGNRREEPEAAFVPAKRHEDVSVRVLDEVTSRRLYVGNLSYAATEVELEALFRGVGNVLSAEVATDAKTQQSKGFAFVEMGSLDEARRAVQTLDNQEFLGRRIEVSGARDEEAPVSA